MGIVSPAIGPPEQSKNILANRRKLFKTILIAVLILLFATAVAFLLLTDSGQKLLQNPRLLRTDIHRFVVRHPLAAPMLYLAVYWLLAVLALPVWWLQILGGLAFGLWFGAGWSLLGATGGATLTAMLVRWIAHDWFHDRIEARMDKLRKLDNTLGHNGFLVVVAVRLVHLLPFGLCNYALGISKISLLNVTVGTFLGSIPAVFLYVAVGAELHPWHNWKFMGTVALLNLLILLPLALRYMRPQWFRKWGLE